MRKLLSTLLYILALQTSAHGYRVRYLNLEQGLSCNFVVDAERDKNGFLWFATEEGLNRFDGGRFFCYYKQKGAKQSLSSSELNCLLDDATMPVLWVGTKNDGLNAFNYTTEEFRVFQHDGHDKSSIATNDITGLCHAENGNLWLATYWQGVEHLDVKTGKFTHYGKEHIKGLPDNRLWCVLDIGDGMIMAGHVQSGLSIIDTRNRTAHNFRHDAADESSLAGNEVCCLYKDRRGIIWVGTDAGIDIFDPTNQRFLHVCAEQLGRSRIYDIRELANGTLCVATELRGLLLIDAGSHPFAANMQMQCQFIGEGVGDLFLSGNSVRCVVEDRYRNLWAGLYGGGINFLTTTLPPFAQLAYGFQGQANGLTEQSVMGLAIDQQGNLWLGTDGNGLNVFSSRWERTATLPHEAGQTVQTALTDSRGDLWFGSFLQGAFVKRTGSNAFAHIQIDGLQDARCFWENPNGQMWIGTSHGIYIVDRSTLRLVRHIDCGNGLVRALCSDSKNNIWVGYYGGGLEVYSPQMKRIAFYRKGDAAHHLQSNCIIHLFQDSRHRVWAATNEGAVCFTPTGHNQWSVKEYDQSNGLENAHIRAICEDKQGNIWLSTNRGISCQKKGVDGFLNFNEKDNVVLANFNDGCVATDHQGRIYFGSARGLCHFLPTEVLAERKAPRVFITSMTLASSIEGSDSTINLINKQKVSLAYDENTFTVNFNTQNYALNRQMEYGYQLRGLQDGWMITDGSITLRDLPAGTYKLLVRSRLHNQPWGTDVAEMTITVRPPLWLSWWAKSLYLIIATLLLIYALKAYLRHLRLKYQLRAETINHEKEQKLNEERLRFFTNITHELRTPITLILGPLDDISHQPDISKSVKHKLAVIHQSAVRLNELISQLLEFRKTETSNRALRVVQGNLVSTVHEICLKYEELAEKPHVEFRFVAPAPIIEMYYDKEVMAIIVDNLVSNALKYTDRGSIDISVERRRQGERHLVDVTVSDTGHGISAKALPHIFDRYFQENGRHQASGTGIGLSLVKSLVALHEGEIKVESSLEQGTSFIVTLDEQNIYPNALHGNEGKGGDTRETSNASEEEQDTTEDNPTTKNRQQQAKPLMLVVEDNKDILDYVADSFADEYETLKAIDGRQGLALALDRLPDIIISDVMMPEMDGNEMCQTLKSDVRTSHIPIILLTAKDGLEDKEAGYNSGADSYITKPFTHSLLRSRINNLLAHRQTHFQTAEIAAPADLEEKKQQLRSSLTKVDQEFFDKLDTLIRQNIRGDVDVNMLASKLAVSPSTLYRKMKALTGMSTNGYIRKIKMQYAEHLLLEGKYTISEVSFMVGMNSVAYFRRCFKEAYGDIPSEYLKKLKG